MILSFTNTLLLHKKYSQLVTLGIYIVFLFLGFACIWREKKAKERYDYNNALITGKLVAGTVYASYPDNVPGLGWI